MEKKTYIAPDTTCVAFEPTRLLAASRFDSTLGDQDITVSDDVFDGEFSSRQFSWSPVSDDWED
ncbi:MAG: hypothetical protein IJ659_08395 [Alloprevotella sp.]|nr:hypothetical protein [Alloprevotella sp.]